MGGQNCVYEQNSPVTSHMGELFCDLNQNIFRAKLFSGAFFWFKLSLPLTNFWLHAWYKSCKFGLIQVDRLIPVAGKEQMQGFSHLFSSHTRKNLSDGHLWFSIFLRPTGSRFTRVQRTACCMMALWLEMLVNIMWYKVAPPASSSSALSIGPFSLSAAQVCQLDK